MRLFKKAVVILSLGLSQYTVAAQLQPASPPTEVLAKLEPMLKNLNQPSFFLAGGGWYGLTAKDKSGKGIVMYVDPSGEYFMTGMMLKISQREGVRNITVEALQQFLSDTSVGALGNKYQQTFDQMVRQEAEKRGKKDFQFSAAALAGLPYIQHGTGPVTVYGFVDPNLPTAKKAVQQLTLFEESGGKGRVALRWLPMSVSGLKSENDSAAVLGSPEPLKHLWMSVSDTKPYRPDQTHVVKGGLKLEQIMQYAKSVGMTSSPVFVLIQNGKLEYRVGFDSFEWFAR